MHPAYSVIVFTVASGAGFGMLAWLALSILTGPPASSPLFYATAFGIAFALAITGLLSSTLHLGRPERAWRAFSQWRTSWLSREAVAAMATLALAGLLALAAVYDLPDWVQVLLALPTFVAALGTVWCTGMIYESLPTIRAWSHPLTTEIYLVLAVGSGALLMTTILAMFGVAAITATWIAIGLLALGALMKLIYWRGIDSEPHTLTAGDATGLGKLGLGPVRALEPPHTQPNFVMREMGYGVARRHADQLRIIALLLGFAIPALLLLLAWWIDLLVLPLSVLAVLSAAAGLLVERWLFFAEAQHVVTLYYGAERA